MKNLKRILTLLVLGLLLASMIISSFSAFARPGAGRGASGDPLCNNSKMTGARLHGCRAIYAQLTEPNSCTRPILQRIADAAARGRLGGMDRFCPNYSQFNGDPHARALIWRNMVAALVMEESSWNPNTRGDGGGSRGLLQFGVSNAGMGPYRCACNAARTDIFNPAHNARCGTHIYIYNIARDMHTGGGPAGRPGSYGAARFFGPYGDAQANKRARMANKVKNYCQSLPRPTPVAPPLPQRKPDPPPVSTEPLVIANGSGAGISERGTAPQAPENQDALVLPAPSRSRTSNFSTFMQ